VRPGFEEGDSPLVGVRFQAEVRTNSIIAIGSENDLIAAEAILHRLDAENLNNRTVFTMKLVNTPAEELATILNNYLNAERQLETQNTISLLPQSPLEQYKKELNIVAEPISNSLIITTTPQYYEIIQQIILGLDERPSMVVIDVLIAEVSCNRSKDRGVEFGLQDSILFDRATSVNSVFPGLSAGNPTTGALRAGTVGSQGITSLIPAAAGTGGFSFSASSESVSIFIRALETDDKTQILTRPRMVTLHDNEAYIRVGQDVPYSGRTTILSNGIPQTETEWLNNVGTTLKIIPRIMPDGMIAMAVFVERAGISEWRNISTTQQAPVVNTTNTNTTINAMDGETVIFAGLLTEEKISKNRSVPGLNKIPYIKHLFEYDSQTTNRSELLIVLTPRIIRTRNDMELLNQQERERMHWCVRDVVKMTGDCSILRRSDVWSPSEVHHSYGAPVILDDSQLPAETKPMLVPTLPGIETK
jgi:type II secretory pathway component GspD/PulD (secretin)